MCSPTKAAGQTDPVVMGIVCVLLANFEGEFLRSHCDLTSVVSRHLPLPQADAQSKQQQEEAIEQLLQELDIDLLVLAR